MCCIKCKFKVSECQFEDEYSFHSLFAVFWSNQNSGNSLQNVSQKNNKNILDMKFEESIVIALSTN